MRKEELNTLQTNKSNTIQNHVGAGPVSAQNGITLIALIITIIVMLILAGVTINNIIGDTGLFGIAETANEETQLARVKRKCGFRICRNKNARLFKRSKIARGNKKTTKKGIQNRNKKYWSK